MRRPSTPGADGRATIVVRRAAPGERLETLDHVERELAGDTLLIADPAGALAVAGVMGGASSEVSDATTRRRHRVGHLRPGQHPPDGAAPRPPLRGVSRFEKGQEPRLARLGADRTAQLIRRWAGGEIAAGRRRHRARPARPDARRVPARRASTGCSARTCRPPSSGSCWPASASRPSRRRRRAASPSRSSPSRCVVAAGTRPPSPRSCRPGAATSPSRPTWPRRSPASAATSSSRR